MLPWEGVELLDTSNGSVVELVCFAVLVQRCVDLTSAEDYAVNLIGLGDGFAVLRIRDDPLEVRLVCKILDVGAGKWVAEEGFGEEENKS